MPGQDLHTSRWYILKIRGGSEKKMTRDLRAAGFEVMLPVRKTIRFWSDRKKQVEEPLFKGYAFICLSEARRAEVFQVDRKLSYLRLDGKPCTLREKEVALLQYLSQGTEEDITVQYGRLGPGTRVEVLEGPFTGQVGLVRGSGTQTTLEIEIPSLSFVSSVQLRGVAVRRV